MKRLAILPVFIMLPVLVFALGTGEKFPSFSALSLNDSVITVPGPVTPCVELVVLTFARQEVAATEAWVEPFIIWSSRLPTGSCAAYSQVAVIGDIPIIGGIIINGMKGAVRQERLGRFLIYTGDKNALSAAIGVDDPSMFYVFLVGSDGLVKWSAKARSADRTLLDGMINTAENLVKPPEPPKKTGKKGK